MAGGFTLGILAILSIYSLALMWERWSYYKKSIKGLPRFVERLRKFLKDGDLKGALEHSQRGAPDRSGCEMPLRRVPCSCQSFLVAPAVREGAPALGVDRPLAAFEGAGQGLALLALAGAGMPGFGHPGRVQLDLEVAGDLA